MASRLSFAGLLAATLALGAWAMDRTTSPPPGQQYPASPPSSAKGGGTAALGSSSCPASIGANAPFACQLTTTLSGPVTWSLSGAPNGMVIQPKTGWIHWTPMTGQTGSYTINAVATGSGGNDAGAVALTVTSGAANPAGLYVSTTGSDSNNGSATAPFRTLDKAARTVVAGQTIYMRGGEYANAEFGTSWSSRTETALAKLTTSGTASQPITVRNFGNEYVRLKSDVSGINIGLGVDYVTIRGLELAGGNPGLTPAIALANWWDEQGGRISGRGITSRGDNITISDCIVRDFPAGGIVSNDAEYLKVVDNLVYNNAWYSTGGTHGISISSMKATSYSASNTIKVTGNLAFGNQSLIISHVFSKETVTMAIDEGSAIHIQNEDNNFKKGILIDSNLMAFSGKGGVNLNNVSNPAVGSSYSPVTITDNDSYLNDRVVTGAADLILNASIVANANGNLFHPRPSAATLRDNTGNSFASNSNVTLTGIAGDTALPSGFKKLSTVFVDPSARNFTPASGVPSGMGVPAGNLMWMMAKVAEYGIAFVEPTQVVDATYMANQKSTIFSSWPASYSNIKLEDPVSGYTYPYKKRCYYPNAPSGKACD